MRLQSPTNIALLKNIVKNCLMFYVIGLWLAAIILVLIKISYKLFYTAKWRINKPKFSNFYIYKLLILAGTLSIARIFTSIIYFAYKWTIWLILQLIAWKINFENIIQNYPWFGIIMNNSGLFFLIIILIARLVPTFFPFSSRKKLGKFGMWLVICIFTLLCIIGIISHILG